MPKCQKPCGSTRQSRRSYACGPCKQHKVRCDHNLPCGSCIRYGRQDTCRISPPKVSAGPATASILLIQPKPFESVPSGIVLDYVGTRASPLTDTTYLHLGLSSTPSLTHITLLLKLLPSKQQCETYLDYYFKHVDYMYHPLHNASFLTEFELFWSMDVADIDPDWLAILFMVLALAVLHLPKPLSLNDNHSKNTQFNRSSLWFKASRRALEISKSGNLFVYDQSKKPSLAALQVFCMAQLYMYATNQIDLLNSWLMTAIHQARVLGLHTGVHGSSVIDTELRRRLWWDICGCDTYQAFCLGHPCTIRSADSTVPFPKNCHEQDMITDNDTILDRPPDEPTIMSFQVARHQCMKILNKLCSDINNTSPTYQQVLEVDRVLCEYIRGLPWFFKPRSLTTSNKVSNSSSTIQLHGLPDPIVPIVFPEEENIKYANLLHEMPFIGFQHHVLHTCNCMHRVRIHQQFLHPPQPLSWNACFASIKSMFLVYRNLKKVLGGVSNHYGFIPQIHQNYSAAVTQGMFLLVEKPNLLKPTHNNEIPYPEDYYLICADINDFIHDLSLILSNLQVDVPILNTGMDTLNEMIQTTRHQLSKWSSKPSPVLLDAEQTDNPAPNIVNNVYSVFGGRKNTENYMSRCSIDFLVNDSES